MAFYDAYHMTQNVIKYANMGIKRTMLIRQIDLCGSEPLASKKMMQKMQKTEMSIINMYFWVNSFVILKGKIANLNDQNILF